MKVNSKNQEKEEKREEVALMRFDIISRAVNNSFEEDSKEDFYAAEASKKHYFNGVPVRTSVPTLKRWHGIYKNSGLYGLAPKLRKDEKIRSKITSVVGEKVKILLEEYPKITNMEIFLQLKERFEIKSNEFSVSTLGRYIRYNKLRKPVLPKLEKRSFITEHVNDMWQADSSFGLSITVNGKEIPLVMIAYEDVKSRQAVSCKIYLRDNAFAVIDAFREGILKYGVPKKLYVDNGKPYVNKQLIRICGLIGVTHSTTAPYSPTSKGAVERFWRTLKMKWLYNITPTTFHSIEEAQASLDIFIHNYNRTVHSTIKRTPFEVFQSESKFCKFLPKEVIDPIFRCYETRKVNNVGVVLFRKNEYEVPGKYIGQYVDIYFTENEFDCVYIFENRKFIECKKLNRVANANAHRSGIKF